MDVTASTIVSELLTNPNELADVKAMSNTSEMGSALPPMPGAMGQFLYSM
nr:hypothetical protein [Candidatus Microthrix sp.]